jgi:hypothetical protein
MHLSYLCKLYKSFYDPFGLRSSPNEKPRLRCVQTTGNHDYGTGSHGDKKFVKIFQQTFFGDELAYPKKDIIVNVAFFCLDSMAEELHWYDELWAQGELGSKQLSALNRKL